MKSHVKSLDMSRIRREMRRRTTWSSVLSKAGTLVIAVGTIVMLFAIVTILAQGAESWAVSYADQFYQQR